MDVPKKFQKYARTRHRNLFTTVVEQEGAVGKKRVRDSNYVPFREWARKEYGFVPKDKKCPSTSR